MDKAVSKSALIAFSDINKARAVSEMCRKTGIFVIREAGNAREVMSSLSSAQPDYVFVDILLPYLPVGGMTEGIYKASLYKRPKVMYFVPEGATGLMKDAYHPSVMVPKNEEELLNACRMLESHAVLKEDELRAEAILSGMGFQDVPARKYLSYACAMCAGDAALARKLKKEILPSVAGAFSVTPVQADNSMRRLIDKAFLTGNIDMQYAVFQNTIDDMRGKPTLSQLIALVGEIVRRGYGK